MNGFINRNELSGFSIVWVFPNSFDLGLPQFLETGSSIRLDTRANYVTLNRIDRAETDLFASPRSAVGKQTAGNVHKRKTSIPQQPSVTLFALPHFLLVYVFSENNRSSTCLRQRSIFQGFGSSCDPSL